MDTFAFIIHPIDAKRDVSRKYPVLGRLFSERQIDTLATFFPPVHISEIEGITSLSTGGKIRGWFVACPLTAARMRQLPVKTVYRKIIQTGRLAERLGARILGLGAFTSVVGDAGITIARELEIPVTTGDSLTAAMSMEALITASNSIGIPLESATAAVVGATGAIGRVCIELLSAEVNELFIIGRRPEPLENLRLALQDESPAKLSVSTDLSCLRKAHLIISVTSALHALIHPDTISPGSVVCDVALPRDVSEHLSRTRDDVLVVDGGIVDVPGDVNFNFDFGLPNGMAFACMGETMALALEGRFEDYTLGRNISRQRVEEIAEIAKRHGFRLSDLRSFGCQLTPGQMEKIRSKALSRI